MTDAVYFKYQHDFRAWLEKHHKTQPELLVGFYKKGSGKANMTWPESVDQALCFGWIDGVRRTVDQERYTIRFTPRRPGSIWSTVNIAKVEILKAEGFMEPAGLDAYLKRTPEKSSISSFENRPLELEAAMLKKFKADKAAWSFFNSLAPSYKRTAIFHVMSAKQETTRQKRLGKLIDESRAGRRLR